MGVPLDVRMPVVWVGGMVAGVATKCCLKGTGWEKEPWVEGPGGTPKGVVNTGRGP